VIEWIEARLRPLPQPPRPAWRIPADIIAREVRALRVVFADTSTAELVERRLREYHGRRHGRLVIVLPEVRAVLAELASS
jgi:hypothetical protein